MLSGLSPSLPLWRDAAEQKQDKKGKKQQEVEKKDQKEQKEREKKEQEARKKFKVSLWRQNKISAD